MYGRNATAGAVNVVTNKPAFDGYHGAATVEAGNYAQLRTEAMFNAPVSETLAIRGAAQTLRHSGYLSDGYNDADDQAARLQALWKPNDRVSLLLFGDYFHKGGVGNGLTYLSRATDCDFNPASPTYVGGAGYPTPTGCNVSTGRNGPWASFTTHDWTTHGYESPRGWTDNLSWSVHAELTLDLGPVVLTDVPAYHHLGVNYFASGNGVDNYQHDDERETSNELRFASTPDSKVKWVAGFFYHDEEQPYTQIFYDNVAGGMGLGSCAGVGVQSVTGNPNCAGPGYGVSLVFPYKTISNPSYAVFGQATFPITPAWRVTGGIRWNRDHKRVIGETDRVYGVTLPYGDPDFPYTVPAVTPFGRPNNDQYAGQTILPGTSELAIPTSADVTWTKTTWKVGIEHDLSEGSLLYANVSTGYKQGGVFAGIAPLNTYQPETLTAYEVGSKNRFLQNRLQVNADVFYYKYRNYQVDQLENLPVGDGTFSFGDDIFNAARATEWGGEVELRWAATRYDEIDLNIAGLHAVFDEFLFPLQADPSKPFITTISFVDLSGTQPTSAPEGTATLAYQHTIPLNDGRSLQLMWQTHVESAYWLAVDHNVDPVKEVGARQRGYTRSQAAITFDTAEAKYSVTAFIRNIENKTVLNFAQYLTQGPSNVYMFGWAPPRTYGVRISVHVK